MVVEILPDVNPKQEAEQWQMQHIQGSFQDMIGKQMLLNTRNLNYNQSLFEELRLAALGILATPGEIFFGKVLGTEAQIRSLGKKIICTKFEFDRTSRRGGTSHLKI